MTGLHVVPDIEVRCCSRCEWDASYQPPEIAHCLVCGALLVSISSRFVEDFNLQKLAERVNRR